MSNITWPINGSTAMYVYKYKLYIAHFYNICLPEILISKVMATLGIFQYYGS